MGHDKAIHFLPGCQPFDSDPPGAGLAPALGRAPPPGRAIGTPARQGAHGALRRELHDDFAHAKSWPELQGRLLLKGYVLRIAGGGLALHARANGTRLCRISDLGHPYSALIRRIGLPFPGHAHRRIAEYFLGKAVRRSP
ncbi:hypothetical protein [Tropicibacter oceani]|uniref:Uncharacterized protein n=1 Tax=Tropicibacter oceani TaxID=3058420 RepID=A0ABY8QKC6_9RHOB|nr:hypothetical protein [Tropicibacter oceani]WGW04272.1 hypothetical protein QF118_01665 [Tropicibacter oceani]